MGHLDEERLRSVVSAIHGFFLHLHLRSNWSCRVQTAVLQTTVLRRPSFDGKNEIAWTKERVSRLELPDAHEDGGGAAEGQFFKAMPDYCHCARSFAIVSLSLALSLALFRSAHFTHTQPRLAQQECAALSFVPGSLKEWKSKSASMRGREGSGLNFPEDKRCRIHISVSDGGSKIYIQVCFRCIGFNREHFKTNLSENVLRWMSFRFLDKLADTHCHVVTWIQWQSCQELCRCIWTAIVTHNDPI